MVAGLVMSTTLVNTGVAMLAGDSKESMSGSNLKDAGGPSINVLTKITCMFSIVETTDHSWTFFFILMACCIIGVLIVYVGSFIRLRCFKNKSDSYPMVHRIINLDEDTHAKEQSD